MRELLARPERWTQNSYARRADGTDCNPLSRDAACWCLVGAHERVTCGKGDGPALDELRRSACGKASASIADWQDDDERRHGHVAALFDKTIARLEATA